MAAGRHIRRRHIGAVVAVVITVAGSVLLVFGGVAYGAYRYEMTHADRILPGVRIDGVDVGGMTGKEAQAAVAAEAQQTLADPLVITVGAHRWSQSQANLGRTPRVHAAVERALAAGDAMGTFDRFWHRFRHAPVNIDIPLRYGVDGTAVNRLARTIAGTVSVRPRDAQIGIAADMSEITFVHEEAGQALGHAAAVSAIRHALVAGDASVTLRTHPLEPKVTAETLGRTIVVHLDQNRLSLYQGFHVIGTWPVATAKPGFTTPTGIWTITSKKVDPTWYNPALDSWGAGEPAVVGPGPGNPMGPRAIYIDAPGLIRIHGTSDPASIGRYASHGCIRMNNDDVVTLFPMIPVGAHVVVVGARPANAGYWDTPPAQDT